MTQETARIVIEEEPNYSRLVEINAPFPGMILLQEITDEDDYDLGSVSLVWSPEVAAKIGRALIAAALAEGVTA